MELRSALFRASSVVDAYCNVPLVPRKFDFRGGTVTGEMHEWRVDSYDVTSQPYRFWPWCKPVQAISALRIYSTPTVYVGIDPASVFINNSAGYVEISSLQLTQFGIFGSGVLSTLIGLHHPVASMDYSYGWTLDVVDEPLEPSDAFLYRAQNQWWTTATPEIKKNGAVITVGFTIDRDEGTILFATGLTATDLVTASYSHKLPSEIAMATGLIAASDFSERDLRARAMGGVAQLTAGEITIRRSTPRGGVEADVITGEAASLLDPYVFTTIR